MILLSSFAVAAVAVDEEVCIRDCRLTKSLSNKLTCRAQVWPDYYIYVVGNQILD